MEEIQSCNPGLDKTQVRNICGAMMFDGDKALKKIGVLSGGEKSRVCLGKLLAKPIHLLILDEPTNHLDPESCMALENALQVFQGSVVLVTHNENMLKNVPTKLLVFDGGEHFLFPGTYPEFLEQIGWKDEAGEKVSGSIGTSSNSNEQNKPDKKERRRLRAERQKEKNKLVREPQKRQAEIEKRIKELEIEIDQTNQNLIQASELGDGKKITEQSTVLHEKQEKCLELYNRLEYIMTQLEEIEAQFEDLK